MYGMLVLQEKKPVNMSNYSPQMIEKMTSKWLSLATTSILGQAPRTAAQAHCRPVEMPVNGLEVL
jgi:hypothetical protein